MSALGFAPVEARASVAWLWLRNTGLIQHRKKQCPHRCVTLPLADLSSGHMDEAQRKPISRWRRSRGALSRPETRTSREVL
jgi:hypothetical protein